MWICCLTTVALESHLGTTYYDYRWTVIRLRHPDPAGFPLPVKSASGRIVCGTAGRISTNYSTPFCTKSDDTAQLTVGISRENLPMKPVDWCSRPPAVCSGANCSRRSGSPLACYLPPADYVRALYLWCKRRCCHMLCWHLMLHRNTQTGICQYSQLEWRDQQVVGAGVLLDGLPVPCPASKSSAPRETSAPTREVACQLKTPKNFWFWKKICLNFELAATLNNVNLMD